MRRKQTNKKWVYKTDVISHIENKGYEVISNHLNNYYASENQHVISVSVLKNGNQYDAVIVSKTLVETDD